MKLSEKKERNKIHKCCYLMIICFVMFVLYFGLKKIIVRFEAVQNEVIIQSIGYIFLYAIEVPVFLLLTHKNYYLKRSEKKVKMNLNDILFFFFIQSGIGAMVLCIGNLIVISFGGASAEINEDITVFSIVKLLVIAPVFEELYFRFIMVGKLHFLKLKWRLIVSAVIFAVPHIYSQGIPQFFYTFLMGIIWAYIYLRYGDIKYTMLFHMVSNMWLGILPLLLRQIGMPEISINILWFAVVPFIAFILLRKNITRISIYEF